MRHVVLSLRVRNRKLCTSWESDEDRHELEGLCGWALRRGDRGDGACGPRRRGTDPEAAADTSTPPRATARSVSGPRARVTVAPRSFLDAGTEVRPGERKFTDYAFPPGYSAIRDPVTNTGGLHRSPMLGASCGPAGPQQPVTAGDWPRGRAEIRHAGSARPAHSALMFGGARGFGPVLDVGRDRALKFGRRAARRRQCPAGRISRSDRDRAARG